MKNYQGAVFFDIDGTLVDERLEIYQPTPKVAKAIKQLQKNGYLVGIATGRARCYLPDFGINFDCYIACNGATCEVDGIEILNDAIDTEELLSLIAFMEKEDIGYDLESTQRCYLQPEIAQRFQEMLDLFHITKKDCFVPLQDPSTIRVNKVLALFSREDQLPKMREFCHGKYQVIRNHKTFSADVMKWHMSKAVGIRSVLTHFNIPIENTYAFGDDDNDFQMLKEVGHAIAMTPHASALDEVAEYITVGVGEDGVYHGLKHYGLI